MNARTTTNYEVICRPSKNRNNKGDRANSCRKDQYARKGHAQEWTKKDLTTVHPAVPCEPNMVMIKGLREIED